MHVFGSTNSQVHYKHVKKFTIAQVFPFPECTRIEILFYTKSSIMSQGVGAQEERHKIVLGS